MLSHRAWPPDPNSRPTYVILLGLLTHVEGDHGGDGVDADEEVTLLLPRLGKLQQEGEVLCQVLAVWPHTVFDLQDKYMVVVIVI